MRAALFCSALAFVFLVDGCGSSCPDKTKSCLGVCVAIDIDSHNCGACGNVCATGQACTAGTCTVVCPEGSTACNNVCVDTETDQANCGSCGAQCPSGQACTAGVCGTSCLAGFSICGGAAGSDGGVVCANELTDSANCGGCGSACPPGSVCNGNGTCSESCASGFSVCAPEAAPAYCANFVTDNQNCGSCKAPCPAGQACSAGICATTCAPGFSSCNGVDGGIGTCANFLTDSVNCGACGKVCDPGQSCTGGTCAETCAAGFSACGGGDGGAPYCANELIDNANCGGCNSPCVAGQVCSGNGTCAESCATGFTVCPTGVTGPYCAKLTTDSNNCGTCGKVCTAGAACTASNCAESCAAGYRVCGGADAGAAYCALVSTDGNNCGSCGNICPTGKACSGGKCTESCASGYSACSNSYCADLTSDVNNCGVCGTACGSTLKAPGCCKSKCTDLATGDPNNCGNCGTVCTGTDPGCCEAGCVDEATDVNNCGGCGTLCSGVEPGCCSSACSDEATDKNNCGACGTVCKSGTTPACCPTAGVGGCTDAYTDSNNCGSCGTVCSSGVCLGSCCSGACGTDATTDCVGSCDSTGACDHPSCNAGYGCNGGTTCKTSCSSSSDCASSYSCWNPPGGSCCLSITNGATVYVDGKLGADTNCCNSAANACQTLTYAMKQIAAAGATGVTISAAWNAKPTTRSDWAPANGETYPIHLGYGVTLKAPGIFFTPKAANPGDVFDVYAYNAKDTGAVTIEGSAIDYAFIGFDSAQANLTGTTIAVNSGVANQTAVPLTLAKVWMNGQTEALNLGGGANVSLGPLPVIIGSGASTLKPIAAVKSPGAGIYCKGAMGNRATLSDVAGGSGSVLQIDQQDSSFTTKGSIYIYDYCDLKLSQSPIIGLPPPCPAAKVDGEGLLLAGGSTASLTGATIQCNYNHGIDMGEVAGLSGSPTLTLSKTLIQHTGQTGLKVNDGTVGPVTNSTFYHCRFGTVLQATGSLDLSGGGNIFACSTDTEPGAFGAAGVGRAAGISVWNETAATSIKASNVAWDANPPGYWTCTDAVGASADTCTCAGGTCMGMGVSAPDDSEAVTITNTNATPIDVTKPSLQSTYTTCP